MPPTSSAPRVHDDDEPPWSNADADLLAGYVAEVAGAFACMVLLASAPAVTQREHRFAEARKIADARIAELRAWTGPAQRRTVFDSMTAAGLPVGVAAMGVNATADELSSWTRHRSQKWDRQ